MSTTTRPRASRRKQEIVRWFDQQAGRRSSWVRKNRYFYEDERKYMRFLVPEGARVLEIGCGDGRLLAELAPSFGVGVDISPKMIEVARERHPSLEFVCGDIESGDLVADLPGPFDYIIIIDTIGLLQDIQRTLKSLHRLSHEGTRVIIAYFSQGWRPVLEMGEAAGMKMPTPDQNWLSSEDIGSLLELADFDVVKTEWRMLFPKRLFGIGDLINRYIGTLPVVRRLSLRDYVVARPRPARAGLGDLATSVIIPCRNEAGNIGPAVERMPRFCDDLEIVFVEGNSDDDTPEQIRRVIEEHPDRDIRFFQQTGRGKGDAVRKGFDEARGDVLMILDADLTVPPEDLPKFYEAIVEGKGEFINGTRLVYPLEEEAMRPLNFLANHVFARIFSWLLNQRFTDTLCGTKVLRKRHYQQIVENREYFGDFDPFGDFDLIFGASKLSLKIVEVPIRYHARAYGEPQISRFRDGWMLFRMVRFAFSKLKAV